MVWVGLRFRRIVGIDFRIFRVAYELAEIVGEVFFDQFSSVSNVLISVLDDDRAFLDHLTLLTLSIENVFDRLIDQFIGILRMLLGEQLFEFLKGKLERIYLFLQMLQKLQRVSALPEVYNLLVKKLFLLLLLLLFLLPQKLLVMRCFPIWLV